MHTSNHSSKRPAYSRVYWLTNPGQKLLAYLDFTNPTPTAPPEYFDDDRNAGYFEKKNSQHTDP